MRVAWTLLAALSALLALSMTADPARADSIERGYIVRIEDSEIYFNIAAPKGLKPGDALRIKRPIELKHPVTRQAVVDWLPLGDATVTAVGQAMGMAVVSPELLAQVAVGDIVETLILVDEPLPSVPERPPVAPVREEPAAPAEPLPEVAPETRAVLAVWEAAAGKPIDIRIGAWEEFLSSYPDSPYADVIREDLEVLRNQRDKLSPVELAFEDSGAMQGALLHRAPTRGTPGEPLDLVFVIDTNDLASAWLHYRSRGASSYSKGVLRREGGEYLRGQIPNAAVIGPGVEYFVEVATRRGAVGAAIGTPEQPIAVAVPEPPLTSVFSERHGRSRISVATAYLDFATFDTRDGERTDAFFFFEADFFYRLRGRLHGIRSGFGILSGKGGFANNVYSDTAPAPKAGFNYGYVEAELRGGARTAYLVRLVAGVGQDGFGLGAEGRFRLGAEDGTNLTLGASRIEDVGFLTELRMQWNAMPYFPLGLAVALTDQPSEGDLGVRLTTDIGYRALSWMHPTLRISYQARTVDHAGIGAGLGLVFDW